MTENYFTIILVYGEGAADHADALQAHYGAARTHDNWPGADQLEPGDLVLVDEVPEAAVSSMIAVNVILLPDNRGVLFQRIELADALAELDGD